MKRVPVESQIEKIVTACRFSIQSSFVSIYAFSPHCAPINKRSLTVKCKKSSYEKQNHNEVQFCLRAFNFQASIVTVKLADLSKADPHKNAAHCFRLGFRQKLIVPTQLAVLPSQSRRTSSRSALSGSLSHPIKANQLGPDSTKSLLLLNVTFIRIVNVSNDLVQFSTFLLLIEKQLKNNLEQK